MPMRVRWHETHSHILLWEVDETFTLAEYYQTLAETQRIVNLHNPEFYYIITDVRRTHTLPSDLINSLRRGHQVASQRYQGTVMLGAPPVIRIFIQLLQQLQIGTGKYHFTDTLDEAITIINTKVADQISV